MTIDESKTIIERDLNCLKQNKALPDSVKAMEIATNALEEIQKYRAIGTPDECRAAVEKQRAKKVTDIHVDEYRCPACGSENTTSDTLTVGDHYCPNCGQRLEG